MGKMTIQQILMQLAGGMGTSIQIFAVTLIFSLPLGLFVALGRMSKNKLLQAVIKGRVRTQRLAISLWQVSENSPPNRTYTSRCIRLSSCQSNFPACNLS